MPTMHNWCFIYWETYWIESKLYDSCIQKYFASILICCCLEAGLSIFGKPLQARAPTLKIENHDLQRGFSGDDFLSNSKICRVNFNPPAPPPLPPTFTNRVKNNNMLTSIVETTCKDSIEIRVKNTYIHRKKY